MASAPTSDEKLMAALSYWGSIVLWFIPPLLIYLLKKDESAFIKKHSLQALILHIAALIFFVGSSIISAIIGFITLGLGSMLIMLVQVIAGLGLLVYYLVLGVKAFQGEDSDIPFITDYIQKNMG